MKDRIKRIRKDAGLTQEKFAALLGLKRNTIATYETGKSEPMDNVVVSICREFHVTEEWLRTGNGEPYKKRSRNQELLAFANDLMEDVDESFKKRFILALSKLNESDWETIEKIVESLNKED